MRIIFYLIRKEFLQIFRNKQMLPIIFFIPVVQLLVLVFAASFEVKVINMYLLDLDNSTISRELSEKFYSTGRFIATARGNSIDEALKFLDENKCNMILIIEKNLEKEIVNSDNPKIQIILNAVDGAAAGIIQNYSNQILQSINIKIAQSLKYYIPEQNSANLNIIDRYYYNPELDYKFYMVPGILVILVTIIGMFLTSMNIVKEKETGTIEQLNVTPIKKYQFIFGKLLPFWFIALFDLAFGLLIGKIIFNIPMNGSIPLIFLLASLYLIVILGFGLLVSTMTDTQQQAMFISWFFVIIFILMSGLFTPIKSMPDWAQFLTYFNPVAQFIEIMRRVLLKGAEISDVSKQIFILISYAFVVFSLAIWRYKKHSS